VALDDINEWVSRVRAESRRGLEGFQERMGYEPGVNEIRLVTGVELDLSELPLPARIFFGTVDEVCLPDIGNGYFLGPAEEMLQRFRGRVPESVLVGSKAHKAFVFGSDGGGAYFALDLDAGGSVLRVVEPTVRDGTVQGSVAMLSSDVDEFLELLLRNIEAFARGREPSF
jgi:hypothetical protein